MSIVRSLRRFIATPSFSLRSGTTRSFSLISARAQTLSLTTKRPQQLLPRTLTRPFYCMCHRNTPEATGSPATTAVNIGQDNRLARDVVPDHYSLVIKTDLSTLSFSGTVEIDVTILSPVPSITLHAASPLKLYSAVISHGALKTETVRKATEFTYDEKMERVSITFEGGELGVGKARIALRFDSPLAQSMKGYYASTFPTKGGAEGEISSYGLTQFEATDARRAFPCFDEPDRKATYAVSLISRTGHVSLSNMNATGVKHLGPGGALPRTELLTEEFFSAVTPATGLVAPDGTQDAIAAPLKVSSSKVDDWEITTFATTPKVSTYLVAWANGEFEHIEDHYISPLTNEKVNLRVYATWEHIHQAGLALLTKKRILPIYEKVFDIPYPLPKLDTLVASDFDAGAMENWGLITGRTSVYLYDETKSGIAAKKRVVIVQSHEVSHQWFGNIVTMDWWKYLWLNESFATLAGELIMIDKIEPTWKVNSSFISEHLASALSLDSLRSSHPIEVECPDEDHIAQIFDAVSYSKGGSVLRMLSNTLGQDVFLKGVSLYLKAHLYGTADTTDLWAGISEASGQDVAKFMHNWITKIGFPVIRVEEVAEGLKVTQNRFLSTGDVTPEEDETIWHVPLELKLVTDGVATTHHEMLTTRETIIPLKDVANSVYKLNSETAGVYRVLYSPERVAKIGDEAAKDNSVFSLNDRMGLVQDASVLASAGLAKSSAALTLISKLGNESENLVWDEISAALAKLASAWWEQPESVTEAIKAFRRGLFVPLAQRIGYEYDPNEDAEITELRTLAIATSAATDDPATLGEYKRRFDLLLTQNDESLIPSDLRGSIFSQSVKHGGLAEYEKVLEVYFAAATPSHKSAAMAAMCATRDPVLLQRTFDFAISDKVKSQDINAFFYGLSANPLAKRQVWTFFKDNYTPLLARFKSNPSILGGIVKASFSTLSSEEDAIAAEKFFAEKDTSSYAQPLSQGLDAVRSKAKWLSRSTQDVAEWLHANSYLA